MYLGFETLRSLTLALPLRAARRLGRGVGLLTWALLRTQRRLAAEHLRFALESSVPAAQRRRIVRGIFCNLGQNAVEWLRLSRMSLTEIQGLVSGDGVEHLRSALAAGNGAIVITAHFGNWELIPLYLRSLGFEGGVLARRLRYPEYESFLISMRGEKGVPTYVRGSVKEVAKVLRANQLIGMLPDQDIDSLDGVFVNFFGHPAYTPVGPAALSVMTGAPIVPCFILREGERFRFIVEPPLHAPRGAERAQAMTQLTQAWSDVVETYIRKHPDHWVWMHRRWKTQPERPAASAAAPPQARVVRRAQPMAALALVAAAWWLGASVIGCAKKPHAAAVEEPAEQQMGGGFQLDGYDDNGKKSWQLNGLDASLDGGIIAILHPSAVGYDPGRTSYMTASAAQVNENSRHVRLEHDVTIHTSDGVWLTTPVLHWIPDREQVASDDPVRIETDHMLLRGRGLAGQTQLKQATLLTDIEMVLNPSEKEMRAPGQRKQVVITCDGPLAFDYEHNVATFEQNVHIEDPSGDLYSDRLVAHMDQATHTIKYAEAIGHVRIHQHENTALSERAVYEPAVGKITLVGKPSLLVYPSDKTGTQLSFGGLTPEKTPVATRPAEPR